MEMHHFWHEQHSVILILNEVYIAKEGDVCLICNEQIVSCKSFVYSCTHADDECFKFLLHKSCAELPPTIEDPSDKKRSLSLALLGDFSLLRPDDYLCKVCGIPSGWSAYRSDDLKFFVCLECAVFQLESPEDRKFHHPAHSQHTLFLVPRRSSFRCSACKMENDDIKDYSYICTTCPFWIHKSCADAPASFRFPCHNKHPLILSFHLPQVYQKFDQHCKLCRKKLYPSVWIYYCPKCRFFAHFQCARSSHVIRSSETYPDLVHLPAADESSSATNVLVEQFVKAMSTETTSSIKQWADCEHGLQLITYNELNDQKDDDDGKILLCDFCVKPIRADGNQFYGCVSCNYFLHTDCAKLPNKIKHPSWPSYTLSPRKYNIFSCYGCKDLGNGICFEDGIGKYIKLHIGCALLPEKIKHEAHPHQLDRTVNSYKHCTACGDINWGIKYRCGTCDLDICGRCIMMERTGKHRWDPHPLCLIYEAEMVADHEHEFNCEFCSQEIDTNTWFYHCSHCDLSFHILCFRKLCGYPDYSNIKFGVTDIITDDFIHPHRLTFVLNKKLRGCERCDDKQLIGEPVLECTPCKVIFCRWCAI